MQTVKDVFVEFCELSSINGLSRITVKNRCRSFTWFVVVISALLGFSFHLYTRVEIFYKYPKTTDTINLKYNFSFPDVTICKNRPFSSHVTLEKIGLEKASRFWRYALKMSEKILDRHKARYYADKSFLYYSFQNELYSDYKKHLVYCLYKDSGCNPKDFKRTYLPNHYNCFTFSPNSKTLGGVGPERGLRLILNTGHGTSHEPLLIDMLGYTGYTVVIHERGSIPPISSQGLKVSEKQQVFMSIKKFKRYDLHTKTDGCKEDIRTTTYAINLTKKPPDKVKYLEAVDLCETYVMQNYMARACGCLIDRLTIPYSKSLRYPICHYLPKRFFYNDAIFPENNTLLYKNELHNLTLDEEFSHIIRRVQCYRYRMKEIDSSFQNYMKTSKTCQTICKKHYYDNHVSISPWRYNATKLKSILREYLAKYSLFGKFDPEHFDNLPEDNFVAFYIFPIDLNVEKVEESEDYPFSALLSDLGGNVGLWIGCSVITLAEVVELLFLMVGVKVKNIIHDIRMEHERRKNKRGRNSNIDSEKQNNISPIVTT